MHVFVRWTEKDEPTQCLVKSELRSGIKVQGQTVEGENVKDSVVIISNAAVRASRMVLRNDHWVWQI